MEDSKLMNIAVFVFLFLVILGAYANIFMYNINQKIPVLDINSPLVVPFLLNTLLLIMTAIILKNEIGKWRQTKNGDSSEKELVDELKGVLAYFVGLVIYILAVKKLHFEVATFVAMVFGMYMLAKHGKEGRAPVWRIIFTSLILVASIRFVFTGVFKIILP
ncbi:Tripartite tricarboxylate transporter TctB family protein [Caldanaerovirga acetigignens]|uniref:Tripartite tricarboxylate transporter TctB family protein n=1 Tax=Caldanaerovirga acetigignens TaxID=447595 RepID=A0A1M7I7W9_9FIRM|nr:Tripartite tricarboxylate transporter TctB family protein [Caldanaerovirga acetigignens]